MRGVQDFTCATALTAEMAYASAPGCMQRPRALNADAGAPLSHSLPSPRPARGQTHSRYGCVMLIQVVVGARGLTAWAAKAHAGRDVTNTGFCYSGYHAIVPKADRLSCQHCMIQKAAPGAGTQPGLGIRKVTTPVRCKVLPDSMKSSGKIDVEEEIFDTLCPLRPSHFYLRLCESHPPLDMLGVQVFSCPCHRGPDHEQVCCSSR